MVALDKEFKEFSENYIRWSDKELLDFRKQHVRYLFAGMPGSPNNKAREALIKLVDKELERRYKVETKKISIFALVISVISLLISIFLK